MGDVAFLHSHRLQVARNRLDDRGGHDPVPSAGCDWYLQAIEHIFKNNEFCKGDFVALGRKIGLHDIVCPTYLLAGESDDITPYPQVFEAEKRLGTPKEKIVKKLVPGGHIGLFMGAKTLKEAWPEVAKWIKEVSPGS
ncbi:MAG: hypothetical protein WAK34_03895 [Rhodoplanes sp.]